MDFQQSASFFSDFFKMLFLKNSGFWLWEIPSETLYFSNSSQGLRKFSGKRRSWKTLIHPLDRKHFIDYLDSMISQEQPDPELFFYHRIKISPKTYQWVTTQFHVMDRDNDNKATRIIALSLNQEALLQWEKAHIDAKRLQQVLDAIHGGLWEWDAEDNKTYYSPYYSAMMGYAPEHFSHELNEWVSRIHPDDIDATMNIQYGYINSPDLGDTFENTYRFLAADGTYKWITSKAKIVERNEAGRARRLLGIHSLNEHHETHQALTNTVNTDYLTGLSSRMAFDTTLATLTEKHHPICLIYIDVDGLKLINDNLNHKAGDIMLQTTAQLIRQAFRINDTVARIGGDEFVILLQNCPSNIARRLKQNIRSACQKHNANPDNLPVFISMGMASTENGTDLFQLQLEADKKMILNKRKNAKNNYQKLNEWIANNRRKFS